MQCTIKIDLHILGTAKVHDVLIHQIWTDKQNAHQNKDSKSSRMKSFFSFCLEKLQEGKAMTIKCSELDVVVQATRLQIPTL